jgi:hypothetical protein
MARSRGVLLLDGDETRFFGGVETEVEDSFDVGNKANYMDVDGGAHPS